MNLCQPNRLRSIAAWVANLPSSPGEKAGWVWLGFKVFGVAHGEGTRCVDSVEVMLSASPIGELVLVRLDKTFGTKLSLSFLVPSLIGIGELNNHPVLALLPDRQGGSPMEGAPGNTVATGETKAVALDGGCCGREAVVYEGNHTLSLGCRKLSVLVMCTFAL
jgi:hypothetical protein